jgi:hypothetical protein
MSFSFLTWFAVESDTRIGPPKAVFCRIAFLIGTEQTRSRSVIGPSREEGAVVPRVLL